MVLYEQKIIKKMRFVFIKKNHVIDKYTWFCKNQGDPDRIQNPF